MMQNIRLFNVCEALHHPVQAKNLHFNPIKDRRQSKTLLSIGKRGSKNSRNSVFGYHLSPVTNGNRKQCVNFFLSSTFLDGINVFDCRLSGVEIGI